MADELRADIETLPREIGNAPVFTRADGKRYGRQEIERAFTVYRTVAGLRSELTIHSIRHTAASWMIIAERPIKEVQEMLGHASLTMTLKYIHLAPTHLRGAVNALAAMRDSVAEGAMGPQA